jgi:hypothetical protein
MVKMKKPGKKKALIASWEGPYLFVAHTNGIGNLDFEEGSRICIIQDADGNQWESVASPLWPSVRMKLTLPKLGIWSPPRLPNV